MANRKFKIILIKPGHYDPDGYVIQWWRSTMPSNSLASVPSSNPGRMSASRFTWRSASLGLPRAHSATIRQA